MKKILIVSLIIILNIGTTQVQALAPRAFQGLQDLPDDCLYEISLFLLDKDFNNFMLTSRAIYNASQSKENYNKWTIMKKRLIKIYKTINNEKDLNLKLKKIKTGNRLLRLILKLYKKKSFKELEIKTKKKQCYYLKKLTIKCFNEVKKEINSEKQEKFSLETQIKILFILLNSPIYKELWRNILEVLFKILREEASKNKINENHISKLIEKLENKKLEKVWGKGNDTILGVLRSLALKNKLSEEHINKLIDMLGDEKYEKLWGGKYCTILDILDVADNSFSEKNINKLIKKLENKKLEKVWGKGDNTILGVLRSLARKNKLSFYNTCSFILFCKKETMFNYKDIFNRNMDNKIALKNTFLRNILFESIKPKKLNEFEKSVLKQLTKFINYANKFIKKKHANIEKAVELKNAFIYSIAGMNKTDLDQLIKFYSDISQEKTDAVKKFIELLEMIKSKLDQDEKIPWINFYDNISEKVGKEIEKAVRDTFEVICKA
jgi:hypothetical protein